MSRILLILSLIGAWYTYNAYRPWFRPGFMALISFFAGWLTAELAVQHLLIQIAVTVVLIALGALEAWPGWLALVICIASWTGMVNLVRRALATKSQVSAALRRGLGSDYLERVIPQLAQHFDRPMPWLRLMRVFPIARRDVVKLKGIPYHHEARKRQHLDVFRHRSKPNGCPVFVYVHGGGWIIGNKEQQGLVAVHHLAARGWTCVSTNYRLSPRATYPDHLIDVKRALHWVKNNIEDHGGDPDFIVIGGGSAGGHLASLAALTAGDPTLQPGFEHADTSVRGCVGFYGVYDWTDYFAHWHHPGLQDVVRRLILKTSMLDNWNAFRDASPVHRIHPGAPPFFLLHGDLDTVSPKQEARQFARRFEAVSESSITHAELVGAQHAFEVFPSIRTELAIRGVEVWAATIYSDHLAARKLRQAKSLNATEKPGVDAAENRVGAVAGAPNVV